MGDKTRIDRDLLHNHLWSRSNRYHRITVNAKELAAFLDVAHNTGKYLLQELVESGRIVEVGRAVYNCKIYRVTDPDKWADGQAAAEEPAPARRQIVWG